MPETTKKNSSEKQQWEQAHKYLRRFFGAPGGLLSGEAQDALWSALECLQGFPFYTAKNLEFTYSIRGYEMFVSRKDKSLTRATVRLALQRAVQMQKEGRVVSGPKKLGVFGASYLYPIFIRIGIIRL